MKKEELDIIDKSLHEILNSMYECDGEIPDDQLEIGSVILFDAIAQMVDDNEIEQLPAEDADDKIKNDWVKDNIPKIIEKISQGIEYDDSDLG
jgi:hypothetical protein